MKEYEYIGVMGAIFAYTLIVSGWSEIGFFIGCISSASMSAYFCSIKSWPSFSLQLFFICANLFGLYRLGVI